MAERFIQNANAQLQPVFGAAKQQIQSQLPAIDQLYATLVQGLQGQAQTAQGDILQSAADRGVTRDPAQIQAALGQSVDAAQAQLGAQQAEQRSGITQDLTGLNVGRVQAGNDIGGGVQQANLAGQENQMKLQDLQRQQNLNLQDVTRKAELSKLQAAQTKAKSTASIKSQFPGYDKNGPKASQRADGGWNFKNATGKSISAAKYADMTGVPLDQLLSYMTQTGDQYAGQAYSILQQATKPGLSVNVDSLKQSLPSLFWGT
jgi:hypothetical protein